MSRFDQIVPSNRAVLKAATKRAHMRAEATWTENGRFKHISHYRAWLQGLQAVHAGLGQAAAQVLGDTVQIAEEGRRAEALEEDLSERACSDGSQRQTTESWAHGVCYALNGSAIGASMLLKSGAIPDHWPQSYLRVMANYASSGGLKAFFDQLESSDLEMARAVEGAQAVFDKLSSDES